LRATLFVLCLAASLPPLAAALFLPVPLPESDSLDYLAYARSLHLAGTYAATPDGPASDRRPGREPLYPLLIAGVAELSPALARSLETCAKPAEVCRLGYRPLVFVNALLLGGAALMAGLTVLALDGGPMAALIGCLYVAANVHMYKDMKYVLSDYLAVFLCAALTLALARRRWLGAGLAAAGLALAKAVFLPFGLLLSAVLAWRGDRKAAALIAALVLVANLGWMERNIAWFGVAGDGRDGLALSTREVFDHMSPAEHRAAWLWWLRGPGAGLARKIMPLEAWERHQWDAEDGFYNQGQVVQPSRIVAASGLGPTEAEAEVKRVVARQMLADWPHYLATLPVLFYRGIWFDEFIAIGLPLLGLLLWRSVRTKAWDRLIILSPGLWSMAVYPAISLNIPRYQYCAVTGLALAAGLVWQLHRDAVAARALRRIEGGIGARQQAVHAVALTAAADADRDGERDLAPLENGACLLHLPAQPFGGGLGAVAFQHRQ
jgi:hypothetical protein